MKVAMTIIGVIVIILLFGTMMSGLSEARTDERTDAFAGVTTGVGVVEADVVLVAELYSDDILQVVSITSDNGSDAPLPDSYTPATNTLTVRGLAASDTRGLSVVYKYDALTGDSAPAGRFMGFLPFFIVIAVVLILVGVMVAAFKNR